MMLFDAHCHLGWFSDPSDAAQKAAEKGLGLLAVTVTPDEFLRLRRQMADEANVSLAAGLHPWWVRRPEDAEALIAVLPGSRFVGEIGLDAAPRHAGTWEAQLRAFERICATCAETSGPEAPKVLSIHAVRATGTVLDVLERTGTAGRCRCILHWFSGSSEELWRAVELGCSFSLGERALGTRRGREYARILPLDRLLPETDLPETERTHTDISIVTDSLDRTIAAVATARDVDAGEVHRLFAINAAAVLDV